MNAERRKKGGKFTCKMNINGKTFSQRATVRSSVGREGVSGNQEAGWRQSKAPRSEAKDEKHSQPRGGPIVACLTSKQNILQLLRNSFSLSGGALSSQPCAPDFGMKKNSKRNV
jgi:hypothetical protein